MKFRIVPSTCDGRHQLLTTYLINETLAIDAGAISIGLSIQEQLRLRSIVITHSHLDHIFSLPLFLVNFLEQIKEPINLFATPADFDALGQYIFNQRVWVPMDKLMNAQRELISYHPFNSGDSFFAEGLKITAIPVTHTVQTHGVLVEDDQTALLFTSDTGATERIWQVAGECRKLRAVFIDLSFPNRMTDLARLSYHHSPLTLLEELSKIKPGIQVYAIHLKMAYRDQVESEVSELNHSRIVVAEVGREYEF
ncbi:MAG: MBL fold metallo-hydrolase [Acidobacteria bacterium]|nr:MBL fold metallo-hydrolase [Acidobacteriota bacterium]